MELSNEIIKQLNDRILSQGIIIQALCNLLIENKVISENELESRLQKQVENLESQLENYKQEIELDFDSVPYFGPIGKA